MNTPSKITGATLLKSTLDKSTGYNRIALYRNFNGTYSIHLRHTAQNGFSAWAVQGNGPTAKDAYRMALSNARFARNEFLGYPTFYNGKELI